MKMKSKLTLAFGLTMILCAVVLRPHDWKSFCLLMLLVGIPYTIEGWMGIPRKYRRGHYSHDNMGPEYEVRFPLLFGYYWCRTVGSSRNAIVHERDLA